MNHLEATYPDIVIRIQGNLYAIRSQHVISIMRMPKHRSMPSANKAIMGIIAFQGDTIPLLDIRAVFDMPTRKQEFEDFASMLESRKQDHVRWVEALESSIKNDTVFTLAKDPHKCAFGQWYDNFHSDRQMINFHLHKIEEPHRKLHESAIHVEKCKNAMKGEELKQYLDQYIAEVRMKYMNPIMELLDETKEVFHEDMKEMVVVAGEEHPVGIVVDEVLSVENLTDIQDGKGRLLNLPSYISGVCQWEHNDDLILRLDERKLSVDFGDSCEKEEAAEKV